MMKKGLIFGICFCLVAPAHATVDSAPAMATPQQQAEQQYVFRLSYGEAEDAIGEALRQKGAGDKVAAFINNRSDKPLFSYGKPLTVEIRGLQFEQNAKRWNASLMFVVGSDVVSALPVGGTFENMEEVPVLKHEVHGGDVIKQGDVEVRDFPEKQLRGDTITDLSELIGKTPVRTISPSRPIREHEIASPALIKKNGIVEMRYRVPGMQISATGQAMGDGAKGDVIEVRNTTSRKIVRGVVEDAQTINILTPDMQTSQLTGGNHVAN